MRKKVILMAVLAASMLILVGHLQAADQVRKQFTIPATFAAMIETTACSASPGPQVTVQGTLTPVGLNAEVLFTNGAPGHEEKTPVSQEVFPANQAIGIPQQSVVGPVTENPYIWLQLTDEKGKALTSEIFLGRCDQAQFNPTATIELPVSALAQVSASSCDSSAAVRLDGQVEAQPISAKLIFRNTNTAGRPSAIVESAVSLTLIPVAQTYPLPQQEFAGGATANPMISLQFRQDNGQAVGSEYRLGRCQGLVN